MGSNPLAEPMQQLDHPTGALIVPTVGLLLVAHVLIFHTV